MKLGDLLEYFEKGCKVHIVIPGGIAAINAVVGETDDLEKSDPYLFNDAWVAEIVPDWYRNEICIVMSDETQP